MASNGQTGFDKSSRRSLVRSMFEKRKTLKSIMEESEHDQSVGSKLSLFDLLMIGIGATIGSGVFVLTGKALVVAGPASVVSWIAAGIICMLSSSAYMELSARLPTKGSCYVFSYHGLGELASVVGAVCLTMEYGISGAGVARSWATKFYSLLNLESWWVVCYNGAVAPAPGCDADDDFYLDPIAALMVMLCAFVLMMGTDFGKLVINSFTLAKVALVAFMIVAGLSCWTGNMFESVETMAPAGGQGIVSATSLLFFGFIGFDEVCCLSSKTENPSKTVPRALAGTLVGAAVISSFAQFSLASMVPVTEGMESVPFEEAFSLRGLKWAGAIVHIGEIVLLPLVVLLSMLPQPEVTAALSGDGLLPSVFSKMSLRNGVYVRGTFIVGFILTIIAAAVPFAVLWDVISIGVLFSFCLTNMALVNIRYGNGGALREPQVNMLVWALMLFCMAAGYALNLGVVQPFLAGDDTHSLVMYFGLASLVASLAVALLLYFKFETRCDMEDPQMSKAWGVPFTPAIAVFFNAFLLSTIPARSLGAFAIFAAAFLCAYVGYVSLKGGTKGAAEEAS